MNVIKKYDAYLTFSKLQGVQLDRIREIFAVQDLIVTLDEDALEFEF